MEESMKKVCVTGGAGYLASFLIKHLLLRGYFVHATLRSFGDASKVGLLMSLPHAHTNLKLFEADIYNPIEFVSAIDGCHVVVHMATPLQHTAHNTQYKNTSEAAVAGVKMIMETCMRSTTVKRVVYTGSVVAASPLHEDGSDFKNVMDETCWTPLNTSYEMFPDYVISKTMAEKEALSYNGKGIEVVSLDCGLVGGDTIQSSMSSSMAAFISQAMKDESTYRILRTLEEIMGKVPILHIQDETDAHIFAIENPHINGRFLCACGFLKTSEIASIIQKCQPGITIPQGLIEDTQRETKWGSRKLEDLGFEYKYDTEKTIHDSLVCANKICNTSFT